MKNPLKKKIRTRSVDHIDMRDLARLEAAGRTLTTPFSPSSSSEFVNTSSRLANFNLSKTRPLIYKPDAPPLFGNSMTGKYSGKDKTIKVPRKHPTSKNAGLN